MKSADNQQIQTAYSRGGQKEKQGKRGGKDTRLSIPWRREWK